MHFPTPLRLTTFLVSILLRAALVNHVAAWLHRSAQTWREQHRSSGNCAAAVRTRCVAAQDPLRVLVSGLAWHTDVLYSIHRHGRTRCAARNFVITADPRPTVCPAGYVAFGHGSERLPATGA